MTRTPDITSTKNPLVRRFRATAGGEVDGEIVLDGVRLAWEAIGVGSPIRVAAVSPKLLHGKTGHDLRSRLESAADEFVECTDPVLAKMSCVDTPQGVILIVDRMPATLDDVFASSAGPAFVVAAAGVRDPGNLGALVRTAEAAGATGFVALRGGADPYRDKAVRGSSGSILRLPVARDAQVVELVRVARDAGVQIVCADGNADALYSEVDLTKPTLLVVGAEARGVPAELIDAASACVRIPIAEPVESLNVAVAAGVLMFEARRQRG